MSPGRLAMLVQLAATLPLCGLIWMVQVVVYPQFARVGPAEFAAYHAAHARLITLVVGPLMLAELSAALLGIVARDDHVPPALAWLGLALTGVAWMTTMFASVPQHNVLSAGFDERAHEVLVATNWIRTLAWSARGALLIVWAQRATAAASVH
jgi:hypothetical protein